MPAYNDADDIYLVFGQTNTRKWANADNVADSGAGATAINNRITWASQKATDYINDRLRRTYYDIPFDTPPQTIIDLSAQLAGCTLYQMPRGLVEGEDAQAAMQAVRDEAEALLARIVAGQIKLDVEMSVTSVPGIVNAEDTA